MKLPHRSLFVPIFFFLQCGADPLSGEVWQACLPDASRNAGRVTGSGARRRNQELDEVSSAFKATQSP
jgi:hypothetical protein